MLIIIEISMVGLGLREGLMVRVRISLLLVVQYYILRIKFLVLRGNCPTHEGRCPIVVIVIRDRCP